MTGAPVPVPLYAREGAVHAAGMETLSAQKRAMEAAERAAWQAAKPKTALGWVRLVVETVGGGLLVWLYLMAIVAVALVVLGGGIDVLSWLLGGEGR